MPVTADTTAMSVPHEIEYTILLDSASIAKRREKTDGSNRSCLRRSRDRSKYHSVADTSEEKRKKRMKQIKKIGLWCVLLFACIQISGCGDSQTSWKSGDHEISSELTYEKSMDLDYATEFARGLL